MALRLRVISLLTVSTVALAGCGGGSKDDVSDLSATQILAKAEKALEAADSVAIEGKGKDEESEIEIDMAFAGDTASGSIAVDGAEFELLGAGGKAYFKATDEFYRANAGAGADQLLALIDGRWVLADPSNPDFEDMASFVVRDEFFDDLLDPDGKITKADEKTIDGVDCIGIESAEGGVFYFAKDDARPISLESDDDSALSFSYDELEEAKAPAADEVFDLASVG